MRDLVVTLRGTFDSRGDRTGGKFEARGHVANWHKIHEPANAEIWTFEVNFK